MSLPRSTMNMAVIGQRAAAAFRTGSIRPPINTSKMGWRAPAMRNFPLQPHAIASRQIQAALDGKLGPQLSVQEVQKLEERTNLAPENIKQLEIIFRTLAGQRRHLDFKAFEAGLPLVQTLQDGGLCPETYLSAFQAFDLDRSGTIEMEEFIIGVAKLIRGENEKEVVPECPSWKRSSRIVRVGRDLRLMWSQQPRTVLVVKKWNEPTAKTAMSNICRVLANRGLTVLVDPQDPDFRDQNLPPRDYCRVWRQHDSVDLVVGLGGDGTMLRAIQWLGDLPNNGLLMPPIMAFALGSLGFLTPHPYENVEAMLEKVLDAEGKTPLYCTMRSRLRCEIITPDGDVKMVRRALNECLVCRGTSSAFQKLDCFVDGQFVAQFQADGVIIATPSGSSAYSMAVGGSLVAPSVPCMLLTPIAPHMLTARPTVLPAGCELELRVPNDARSLPMVSFDGMHEEELPRGACVRVATSMSPVPFIHMTQHLDDWFHSISTKLHWATRLRK